MTRFAAFAALSLLGQGSLAQSTSFEVASIKTSAPGQPFSAFRGLHHGTFTAENIPLRQFLSVAYGLSEPRIDGPEWLDKTRFDIVAKSPEGVPDSELPIMLQSLLKERFKLKAHIETRAVSTYNLVIAKGGVKMPLYPAHDRAADRPGDDRNVRGFPMMRGSYTTAQFADTLAKIVGRPVIDKTGLTERYSIFLSYAPLAPPPAEKVQDFGPPDIFIAVQEQLGLKLERGKGNLDVVVIDRIEPLPTAN
jgi:uncharacterized protein (TIGR03435 family)